MSREIKSKARNTHFHWNMVTRKPLTACGLLGTQGVTNAGLVTCPTCHDWLNGTGPAVPKIRSAA